MTVITVDTVDSSSGEKNGRTWTKYALKDTNGQWYSTFSRDVIEPAYALKGLQAEIEFETKGQFKNLVSVKAADPNAVPVNQQAEQAFRATTPDGAPDWDVKNLRINRCAYWKEMIGPAMQEGLAMWRDTTTATNTTNDLANFVRTFGEKLRAIAEADVYSSKQPARPDDDIPF